MKRIGFAGALLAALIVFPVALLAQIAPDDLIITGGGWGKGWDTEIELADSEVGTGTSGSIFTVSGLSGPCPPVCENVPYRIPPKGTVRMLLSETFPHLPTILTVHVTTDTEQPLPIVRARVFNGALPTQSADVPIFRNPTLSPRNFPVLVFPGLRRGEGVYSNLILQGFETLRGQALVEAFGPDGRLLGSEVVSTPKLASEPLVLVDIAARLGADAVDGGQVRVTNQSGGFLWGVLATVYADGRLTVVSGANP
jgi:hypothetical protein